MDRFRVLVATGIAGMALVTLSPSHLRAQGYGVYEQGTCVMGRAGTGVASPCPDGSSIYFNPAGIASARSTELGLGATGILVSGGFTSDQTGFRSDLNKKLYPVPHGYFVRPLSDRLTAGLGVFVPYGLTTDWPASSEARFLGYHNKIQAIYLQPTVAARVMPWLRAGAGLDLTFVHVKLQRRIDLSSQAAQPGVTFAMLGVPDGTDFADVMLHANATGFGAHFGVQADLRPDLTIGARFMLRQKISFDHGTAEFTQVPTGLILAAGNPFGAPAGTPMDAILAPQFTGTGPLQTQAATTSLTLPSQLVLGVSYRGFARFNLLADFQYTDWTVFDSLTVALEHLPSDELNGDFKRAYTWRFGAEYTVSPETIVRAGFYTHNAAAPDENVTPNLPEGRRNSFTVGVGTRITDALGVDVAYQHIDQGDRRGRTVPLDPGLTPAENTDGVFQFGANLVGATLRYTF
jgi:long-chain fatty acid transport protein